MGVAVDVSGIYVVGFDSSPGHGDLEWRVEKISAEVATPFYMQTWFIIVSMAVSVIIILFAVVIIMHRQKRVQVPPLAPLYNFLINFARVGFHF